MRLADRSAAARRLARREVWIANARLAFFVATGILAWLAFVNRTLTPLAPVATLAAFCVLVVVHDRTVRRRRTLERAVDFHEAALARRSDAWIGRGVSGERFLDRNHPYAVDLDLFGAGSLFERLCVARTRIGERILADWLRAPAPAETIRSRQPAVEELASALDLREALAVQGAEGRGRLDPEPLLDWARGRSAPPPAALLWAGRILAVAAVGAAVGYLAGAGGRPLAAILIAQGLLAAVGMRRVGRILRSTERPDRELGMLSRILGQIEDARFRATHLRRMQESLRTEGLPPSARIARLARLMEAQEWSRNLFFAPIAILLNWNVEIACGIEAWRKRHGAAVPVWIEAAGEIEALASLAAMTFEEEEATFPEVVEPGPCIEGERLGHPLIRNDRCVRNDVRLGDPVRLLVVSGSNMSGKSTLLRAIGVNAVLALAGGPVRARRLRISPLQVGASIRTNDSLHDGRSRFYAEILRLRQLVDLASGPESLLFLIDEVLHGTNSHDRRIGAAAVVRGFVERGGIGLVTTHDLALSRIVEELHPRARNVHFEDRIEGEEILFDYRLLPGVVERSNALALMRSIGLEI
ncbi:MAG: DNA mismatch repair protein MutS [Candidatus Eisenbacteria bacterium]|nr:DNA mismatch repair protein MutS [Candidatus Latescibacterota bacterium]MBD3302942.1 DNA mismatch repair protein MutS [Candidatus Eisenbacteria bacterium]